MDISQFELTVTEAKSWLAQGVMLIDVREQHEWEEVHIASASLLPLSEIELWWNELPRHEKIMFYCRSGARSGQVVQALISQSGYTQVYNMTGGIKEWEQKGLPVVTTSA